MTQIRVGDQWVAPGGATNVRVGDQWVEPTGAFARVDGLWVPLAASGPATYLELILADDPSFVYPLDEVSGNAISAVGGPGLVNLGGDNAPAPNAFGPGLATPDRSLGWDGGNPQLLIGPTLDEDSDFDLNQGDFTVEAWVRGGTGTGNYRTIGRLNYSTSGAYILRLHNTTNLVEGFAGGLAIGTTTVDSSAWFHVAFVRTGSSGQVYVNGVADGDPVAGQVNGVGGGAGSNFLVGAGPSVTERFKGDIAWTAGYKSALTAARLLARYQYQVP